MLWRWYKEVTYRDQPCDDNDDDDDDDDDDDNGDDGDDDDDDDDDDGDNDDDDNKTTTISMTSFDPVQIANQLAYQWSYWHMSLSHFDSLNNRHAPKYPSSVAVSCCL